MKVLLTGATGFFGRALVNSLVNANCEVVALVRSESLLLPKDVKQVVFDDLMNWSVSNASFNKQIQLALKQIDIVIHLAARVHIMVNSYNDPFKEYRCMNRDATLALARMAGEAGVKRFIFISSVKVNGEMTELNKPFTSDDQFVPNDPYGLSKYEAEQGLLVLTKEAAMEVVIIRPPLVYGPGVRANFKSMIIWLNKGLPLPLGAIHNQRSLVALDNLISFTVHCIYHPKAANEIFLISDGEDVSTTELLQKISRALDRKPLLISVPVRLMVYVARLIGKADVSNKLFSSLQVDSSKARSLLNWEPVITMDEQLKKTVDAYLNNEKTL